MFRDIYYIQVIVAGQGKRIVVDSERNPALRRIALDESNAKKQIQKPKLEHRQTNSDLKDRAVSASVRLN